MYNPTKPYKHRILKLIESTWNTPYVRVRGGVYPLIERKFPYQEVDHTDGIGTKGFYHWRRGSFRSAVIDALAMNLNDLALVRAIPYKLSNHITVPVEDRRVLKIVQEMVKECRRHKIAVVGGENSFHNNLQGLDISMTVSGFVKKPRPNKFHICDILIGLKSSGLHANGFTTVREIFGRTVRPEFTRPTAIYLDDVLRLDAKHKIHGMMHITGGAFTKLKDILGKADAIITHPQKLQPQKIFREMFARGLSDKTMYSTFNCGIGFVLSVPRKEAKGVLSRLRNSAIIGKVVRGSGQVRITSAFDQRIVRL